MHNDSRKSFILVTPKTNWILSWGFQKSLFVKSSWYKRCTVKAEDHCSTYWLFLEVLRAPSNKASGNELSFCPWLRAWGLSLFLSSFCLLREYISICYSLFFSGMSTIIWLSVSSCGYCIRDKGRRGKADTLSTGFSIPPSNQTWGKVKVLFISNHLYCKLIWTTIWKYYVNLGTKNSTCSFIKNTLNRYIKGPLKITQLHSFHRIKTTWKWIIYSFLNLCIRRLNS